MTKYTFNDVIVVPPPTEVVEFTLADASSVGGGSVYASLEDVKILTSLQGGKIRYSDSFKALTYAPSSAAIRLTSPVLHHQYAGAYRYAITFSDSTSFAMSEATLGFLGSGNISQSFVSSNGMVSIPSNHWSGVAANGNIVKFETDSNISDYSGRKAIEYAETMLYGEILVLNILRSKAEIKDFLFADDIRLALARIFVIHRSAWKIYFDCYPDSSQQKDKEAPGAHWVKIAGEALKDIIYNVRNNSNYISRPEWVASDMLFKERGIGGVGEGTISIDNMQKNLAYSR